MTAALLALAIAIGAAQRAAEPRITLERSACFGACPVYTLTIDADGSVTFDGREHVRVKGHRTWRIPADAVSALAREMEQAGFFDMKNRYTAPVTDLPTTLVTLASNGRTKRISDYAGAPLELTRLEARIDAVSGARGRIALDADGFRAMRQAGWPATAEALADLLGRAARWGDAELVKALLEAGADARGRDGAGVTPVMLAAQSGDPDTVRALLAGGGDPTARDRDGRNAADRARDRLAAPNGPPFVEATGLPKDYARVLTLLTDE
jgi:hypothetical protein